MRPRIIVLEDDEEARKILALILERHGYEVVCAGEPTACPLYSDLEGDCGHEFPCGDFLISDNRMPRMTGLQFVARQIERGCKGAIRHKALLSGTWEAHEIEAAERLGCKVFTKPCKMKDIFAWLEQHRKTLAPGRRLAPLDGAL